MKDLRVAVQLIDRYQTDNSPTMESVKSLTLGLQNLDVATDPNILHLIQFPAISSFRVELGLFDLSDLGEALHAIHSSFRAPGPTSVTDLTLAVGRDDVAYRGEAQYK